MTIVKSPRRTIASWFLRIAVALPIFLGALWIVLHTLSSLRDDGTATFSIVASAVLIAGLAVEELIGGDLRRLLRL